MIANTWMALQEYLPCLGSKNLCSTFYYVFGTCSIGKVIDETLAVHGVEGLRVCDASIFSRATRLNPQQATMTMA